MDASKVGKSSGLQMKAIIAVACLALIALPARCDDNQPDQKSGMDINTMIQGVLKNLKSTPGAKPGTVDFSVPGLVHGTVRMPGKTSGDVQQSSADEPVSLDIHLDGDGESAGLPKGAVPDALNLFMPGKSFHTAHKQERSVVPNTQTATATAKAPDTDQSMPSLMP